MTKPGVITVYTDYKSPYAYLAKDLAYELERDLFCPTRLAALYPRHTELSRLCPCGWVRQGS